VSTTLFSMNNQINDSITKYVNSSDIVLKNVLLLKEYGIKVDVKVPIMKKNYKEYALIADFCKKYSIDINYSVAITKRTNGDEKPLEYGLCQEQLNEFIDKNDLKSKHVYEEYKKEEYLCKAVGRSMAIDVYGNVYPCNSFLYKYGNVYNDSVYDIWYNLPERQKLKQIKKKDIKKCIECEMNTVCTRCPGLAFSENGNIYDCSEWSKKLAIARIQ
ncbi:MAG: SPASM domain-containing protein, partial [Lachnospiraceae bacterium]|nr:SPASM domain-containing protein [Lachnospiraceae bacterium]